MLYSVRCLAPLVLLIAIGLMGGCFTGSAGPPEPTSTPTVTATPTSTNTPTPTATLVPGQRRRWGFNPVESTGESDPPLPEERFPAGYRVERLFVLLDRPTQLAATPDGRMLVAEQSGAVRVLQNDVLLDEPLISVDVYLPDLEGVVELGLTGIVVDPQFEENGLFYLYYAADNPRRTVVARAHDDGNGRATGLEEILSWQVDFPPKCCHISGGMRFAPDGTLFIGVGDHEQPIGAQNPFVIPGSVLRINPDGSTPADNPFEGPVYAYGLRNPYDIAIDPESGRIFTGENGFFGQDAVVEVKKGANYGWPGLDLRVPEAEIEPPLTFYHVLGGIAGMEFYTDDVLGELQGSLFYCRFHGATIHQIEFNDDGSVARETIRGEGCTTDITTGADGFLYYLNYVEGALYRISVDR